MLNFPTSNYPDKEYLFDRARKNFLDLEKEAPEEFQRFVDSAILDIPTLYEEIFDDTDLFDLSGLDLEDLATELFLIVNHIQMRRIFYRQQH